MVRDLAARLDAAGSPGADARVLDQLQQQVEALAGRFERSEHDLSLLPTLAASVRKLFDQLETVRASVETSAAETARELLRLAADDRKRQPAAEATQPVPDVAVAIQSMLGDVHDVLDKMVGRLSAVESSLAEVRARPAEAPPTPSVPSGPSFTAAAAAGQPQAVPPVGPVFRPATQRPAAPRMPGAEFDIGREAVLGREPILPPAARRAEAPGAARFPAGVDEDAQRLNFIAAARRAAKSAQIEAAQVEASQVEASRAEGMAPRRLAADGRSANDAEVRAGLLTKSREYVAAHKRPVLMGLAAILVVVGTLALLQRTGLGGSDLVAVAPQPAKLARSAGPAAEPRRFVAAADELTPSALPKVAPTKAAPQDGAVASPPSPATLPSLAGAAAAGRLASAGLSDPTPTGSITSLPAFAAQTPIASRPPLASGLPAGLQAAAEAGSAAAQYDLGARYADGRAVTRDPRLAAAWLGKAADQGLAPAQYRLAMLYEKGTGVVQDKPRARALYTAAAEAGNPRAMHNLAVMLADGDGHPDYAAAAGWFRKAAGYGVHDSQYNLAILLARGLGTAQSLVQSYQWFAVAAAQDDADAAHKRDEVGSKLNSGDLALAKSLAAAYQPKAADPAAVEVAFPAGDGASGASHLNSVKSKVSSL